MAEKILQQGAEAIIILNKGSVTKRRVKKSYRLYSIDERIRKLRTRSEGKLLEKAGKIIDIPAIINIDEKTKEITMDFIDGKKLSDNLDSFPLEKQKNICRKIGENVALLHDADVIHGDLTTSNMIYASNKHKNDVNDKKTVVDIKLKNSLGRVGGVDNNQDKFRIFFIDFGLGFHSHKAEDKAVDIHLLKQALEAKHFKHWQDLFVEFQKGYSISKHDSIVMQQFRKVESRGRYKDRY